MLEGCGVAAVSHCRHEDSPRVLPRLLRVITARLLRAGQKSAAGVKPCRNWRRKRERRQGLSAAFVQNRRAGHFRNRPLSSGGLFRPRARDHWHRLPRHVQQGCLILVPPAPNRFGNPRPCGNARETAPNGGLVASQVVSWIACRLVLLEGASVRLVYARGTPMAGEVARPPITLLPCLRRSLRSSDVRNRSRRAN